MTTQANSRNTDDRSYAEAAAAADKRLFGHRLLSAHEEVNLAKRIERGDFAAKEELITHNVRLAQQHARRASHACSHLETADLFAAAIIGLNRAAEKFDYRKGFKFSTYATWWIKQSIQREITTYEATIRHPAHVAERNFALSRARQMFLAATGVEPTDSELAEATECEPREIAQWRRNHSVVSLNRSIGDDQEHELGDLIPDPDADTFAESAAHIQEQEIQALLTTLPPDEATIIRLRIFDEKNLKTAAKELGLTTRQARALEHRATRTLREQLDPADATQHNKQQTPSTTDKSADPQLAGAGEGTRQPEVARAS